MDGENEMNVYLPALSDENVLLPLPTKKDVYMSALTLRPEIEASKLSVEASELGIDIAKAGYLPTISLSAGIGTNHTSGSDFTFGEQVKNGWNNSIGVSVSVPIFNNRQTKSAVQKAKLQRETSLLSLLDEQKTLYKTIEGLWLDANSAQQRYAAANEKPEKYTDQLRPDQRTVQSGHEEYSRVADGKEQLATSTAGAKLFKPNTWRY